MGIFSIGEQKIQNHIQSALQPGEQVQQIAVGVHRPIWTFFFSRIGIFFWKNYIVATTNQRVVFVEHGSLLSSFKAKRVDSVALNEGVSASLGWGIFNKTLTVEAQARQFKRKVEINRFLRSGNLDNAQTIVSHLSQPGAALGGAPQHGQLSR